MGFDFPASPALDEIFTPGEASYSWNGYAWRMTNKVAYPEPNINAVNPSWCYYDETPTVQVTGTQFHTLSTVVVKAVPDLDCATTYISATELSAIFTPNAWFDPLPQVTVETGALSSPPPFPFFQRVNIPLFHPTIPMSPTSAPAGSADFTLTVPMASATYYDGQFGEPVTEILWDGVPIPTTVTTNLTAAITPDATPGTHEVSVQTGRLVTTDPPQIFTFT
jgi:hypothetical protein